MSIKKNILVVYSTQVLTIIISFLAAIFLSRILGAEGRGEQALFSNAIAFSSLFFGFSITSTITYFLNSGKMKVEKLFFSLLFFSVATSVLVFITLMVMKQLNLLHLALPDSYQHIFYILLFVLAYFFSLYASILSSFLTTYKIFKRQNVLILIPNILLLVFYMMIYFKVINYPILYTFNLVIGAFVFNAFVNLMIMYLVFKHEIKLANSFSILSLADVKLFITYSFFAYVANVAQFLSYRLDIWTVDTFCGKYNLGVYAQAITLLQMLWVLPNTFAGMIYSYASASTFDDIREQAMRMTRFSFYATFVAALLFLVFSYFMVPILFGEQFAQTVPIIFILVSGYVLFSIPTTAGSLFGAYGHFRVNYYIGIAVAIVSVFLYYFFTKKWGIHGAAIASVISYSLSTTLCVYALRLYFNIRTVELFDLSKDVEYIKLAIKNMPFLRK